MKKRYRFSAALLALLLFCAVLASCAEKVKKNGSLDLLKMDLSPYIELGDYRSLSFALDIPAVTDADVENAIDDFKASLAEYEDFAGEIVDRPTEENDYIQVSYVGRIEGEIVDECPADSAQYMLLAEGNGFYDWINSALLDVAVGQTVIAEGQLNSDEKYGEHAGKTIVYEIKLHAIMGHYTFHEATDAVVLEKTGYATLEDYRAGLYTDLDVKNRDAALAASYQEIWDAALADSKILKYPEKQLDYYYNAFLGNYEYVAYQNGVSVDVVMSQQGVDKSQLRDMARRSTAEDLFYYALVQAEGLEVTEEEYAARVGGIAAGQEMTVEELEAEYGKDYILDSMLYDEAILFVASVVQVTYNYK